MTRFYGVLALAAAMACVGCESSSMNNSSANRNPNDANMNRTDANATAYVNRDNNGNPQTAIVRDNNTKPLEDPYSVHNSRGSDKVGAQVTTDDRVFLVDAATGGAYEVASSELALTKTSDGSIKQL